MINTNTTDYACENKFVVCEGCVRENYGQRFYSTHRKGTDERWCFPEEHPKGIIAYKVLAFVDTSEEALHVISTFLD